MKFEAEFKKENGEVEKAELLSRIDTADELEYFKNGGILQYVLRNIQSKK
jgi:aconitate hydratase